MYRVFINGKDSVFDFLDTAIKFAKLSGVWYYIATDEGIVRTQNDDVYESMIDRVKY